MVKQKQNRAKVSISAAKSEGGTAWTHGLSFLRLVTELESFWLRYLLEQKSDLISALSRQYKPRRDWCLMNSFQRLGTNCLRCSGVYVSPKPLTEG